MIELLSGTRLERATRVVLGTGLSVDQDEDGNTIVLVTDAGGAGGVSVQDGDTTATSASLLVFQGDVVSVDTATGTATLDLDSRYRQSGVAVPWADLSGIPAYASRWPAWTDVTSKPSAFPPSAHTHAWSDITSGVPAYATRWPTLQEINAAQGYPYIVGQNLRTTDGVQFSGVTAGDVHLSGTIYRTGIALPFLSSPGVAQGIQVGGLLVSSNYNDQASVPSAGVYVKGPVLTGDRITATAFYESGL